MTIVRLFYTSAVYLTKQDLRSENRSSSPGALFFADKCNKSEVLNTYPEKHSRWIASASTPRMTTTDSANALPATSNQSIYLNRLDHIATTSRTIATTCPHQRADALLIQTHPKNHKATWQLNQPWTLRCGLRVVDLFAVVDASTVTLWGTTNRTFSILWMMNVSYPPKSSRSNRTLT